MKNKLIILLLSIMSLLGLLCIVFVISIIAAVKTSSTPIRISGDNNIAILEINGVIVNSSKISETIRHIKEEPNIRAVIVRINTPGGAVGPSQEIYSELLKLRKKMPVYASLGTIATSGGYYIAAACEKIYSNPGTLTGSIGVIMNFLNLKDAYKTLKLDYYSLKSGKFKDIGNGKRRLNKEETQIIQSLIKNTFNQFKDAITKTRKIKKNILKTISDGRIVTGLQAKNFGLVDKIGTLNDTIEAIAQKANLGENPNIIYPMRKKESLLDYVFENSASAIINKIKTNFNLKSFFLPDRFFEVLYENN